MKKLALFLTALAIGYGANLQAQEKSYEVEHFDKVIISPHIQVTFIKGDKEEVILEDISVSAEKMNVEVNGRTLRLYLDDAKFLTKNEKVKTDRWKGKKPIYTGTVATAKVFYRELEELSLRGEETIVCESPLDQDEFRLKIYGESEVYLNKVALNSLHTTIYGESYLEVKEGELGRHKITAYGETRVNALGVESRSAKVTAYGEGSYRLKVEERLKVTAYGEAIVAYEGDPDVDRGIILGEARIQRIY